MSIQNIRFRNEGELVVLQVARLDARDEDFYPGRMVSTRLLWTDAKTIDLREAAEFLIQRGTNHAN